VAPPEPLVAFVWTTVAGTLLLTVIACAIVVARNL